MSYVLLSKLFNKKPKYFERRYKLRYLSEFSVILPININKDQAFFTTPMEMLNQIERIFKLNSKINVMLESLPDAAVETLKIKAFKNEIVYTNNMKETICAKKDVDYSYDHQDEFYMQCFKPPFIDNIKTYTKLIHNDDFPINTCEDIRNIYDELVSDKIDSRDGPDGFIFRRGLLYLRNDKHEVIYKCPIPEVKVNIFMTHALEFLKDDAVNMLIRIAVFHYLYGYIHPFYDGNGRTCRFITNVLLREELGIIPALSLSEVIKNNLKTYNKAFEICNDPKNKGEITHFILMFFNLLEEAETKLVQQLSEATARYRCYCEYFKMLELSDKKYKLVTALCQNALFADTFIVFDDLVNFLGISNTSARVLIKEFDALKCIRKTRRGRKVAYSADLNRMDEICDFASYRNEQTKERQR